MRTFYDGPHCPVCNSRPQYKKLEFADEFGKDSEIAIGIHYLCATCGTIWYEAIPEKKIIL